MWGTLYFSLCGSHVQCNMNVPPFTVNVFAVVKVFARVCVCVFGVSLHYTSPCSVSQPLMHKHAHTHEHIRLLPAATLSISITTPEHVVANLDFWLDVTTIVQMHSSALYKLPSIFDPHVSCGHYNRQLLPPSQPQTDATRRNIVRST